MRAELESFAASLDASLFVLLLPPSFAPPSALASLLASDADVGAGVDDWDELEPEPGRVAEAGGVTTSPGGSSSLDD
jgi:hypothetical protein